jgi:hypothetical protein
MSKIIVPLERRFSRVVKDQDSAEHNDYLELWGYGKPIGWPEIDARHCTVILAPGGAGKTHEMELRAKYLLRQGRPSFFIRIEDIDASFETAFEVGSGSELAAWLNSSGEGWFFLDSVDEARLRNRRAFERALRQFESRIRSAKDRAHICISSRPYAWQPQTDFDFVDQLFPSAFKQEEATGGDLDNDDPPIADEISQTALEVYQLKPLDLDDQRLFAGHHSVSNADDFIAEIERADLTDMAGRPFDLEGLIGKWKVDGAIGGRLQMLDHIITQRLNEIEPGKAHAMPLSSELAREGAQIIAAAVLLTGEPGIHVPDAVSERQGIVATDLLPDWNPRDVTTLLSRPIFNDVLFGMVRFRHRDVRELLAAEWFAGLIAKGLRSAVEALIFRESHGQDIVTPRLRPMLPWLILMDDGIREKAVALAPDIAMEGGDVAQLLLPVRQTLLQDVVALIARREGDSVSDNTAISRIAQADLTNDVLALIQQYFDNDDVIFFLGRLVWQGAMSDCVLPLLLIARNAGRGKYARIASARAVMTCGSAAQKDDIWQALLEAPGELSRELLAEMLENSPANGETIARLLKAIDRLPPYKRYSTSGLSQAIHRFVERMPVEKTDGQQPLFRLVEGLNRFLDREPWMERGDCHVSEEFAWLMAPATHAVERLVAAQSQDSLLDPSIAVMLKIPAVRFWRSGDVDEYKNKLGELVPAWTELNDKLFWQSVAQHRAAMKTPPATLTIVRQIDWFGHYWKFDTNRFDDVVNFVRNGGGGHLDDKSVALSLAFQLYEQAGKPADWLEDLRGVVADIPELERFLTNMEYPQETETMRKMREEQISREEERARQKQERQRNRAEWIARLRANPDIVRYPPGLAPDQFSNDQYWLLGEIEKDGNRISRGEAGTNWQSLIPDFGEDVAKAFRDAAIAFWQVYNPGLRSEGADTGSIPYALIFAMTGLSIEAHESEDFPAKLSAAEVELALRYLTTELNGFPNWLPDFYKAHPQQTIATVRKELDWELANSKPDQAMHYILHDLAYYAPWLHREIAPILIDWIAQNEIPNHDVMRHSLTIIAGGEIAAKQLAETARQKIERGAPADQLPIWYALWVDNEPDSSIVALETWLASLDSEAGTAGAQQFIVTLVGGRGNGPDIKFQRGLYKQAQHLKALYVLMHRYIRVEEDINRADGGVYSPEQRDDGQDARNSLFAMLAELQGKEAYTAITDLITEHPATNYRAWMARRAKDRAVSDGDLAPWSVDQIVQFGNSGTRTPRSNPELFEQGMLQLKALKHWLEGGNESPAATWQRVDSENEMRNLIAGQINQKAAGFFRCAQENQLPNSQRPDIWIASNQVQSPVPIELKLLDKGWSGPKLCERLRNQLVGDYLREDGAECGVMLLVWQGKVAQKKWKIGGQLVGLSELSQALQAYWTSISKNFPSVSAIKVVVIDLTVRDSKASNGQ